MKNLAIEKISVIALEYGIDGETLDKAVEKLKKKAEKENITIDYKEEQKPQSTMQKLVAKAVGKSPEIITSDKK